MITTPWRLVSLATPVLLGSLVASSPADQRPMAGSKDTGLRLGVLCVVSKASAFTFPAGNDRCFKEINGHRLEPQFTAACFLEGDDRSRLTFVFSAVPKPECGGRAAHGDPATREQYEPGLAALGPQEKAFFLKHVGPGRNSAAK